jgi:hypothetical protein
VNGCGNLRNHLCSRASIFSMGVLNEQILAAEMALDE